MRKVAENDLRIAVDVYERFLLTPHLMLSLKEE
jgi:hypothetical protein